jgi:hypothetical protein
VSKQNNFLFQAYFYKKNTLSLRLITIRKIFIKKNTTVHNREMKIDEKKCLDECKTICLEILEGYEQQQSSSGAKASAIFKTDAWSPLMWLYFLNLLIHAVNDRVCMSCHGTWLTCGPIYNPWDGKNDSILVRDRRGLVLFYSMQLFHPVLMTLFTYDRNTKYFMVNDEWKFRIFMCARKSMIFGDIYKTLNEEPEQNRMETFEIQALWNKNDDDEEHEETSTV